MKKAYIHVGAPKAGSTAIQIFCRDHVEWLAENGVFYPAECCGKFGAHHKLHYALKGKNGDRDKNQLQSFEKALRETIHDTVLISTEALYSIFANRKKSKHRKHSEMKRLTDLVRRAGFEPHIVLVLRDAPSAMNSSYIQSVKSFAFGGTIDDWVKLRTSKPIPVLQMWTQFSDQNLCVLHAIAYDEAVRRDGVIPKFLECLNLPVPVNHNVRANRGTDNVTIAAALTLIGRLPFEPKEYEGPCRHPMRAALLAAASRQTTKNDNYWGLSEAQVSYINRFRQTDQEEFARRHWAQSWNEVFGQSFEKPITPAKRDELSPDQQKVHDLMVEEVWSEIEDRVHQRYANGVGPANPSPWWKRLIGYFR